MPEALKFHQYVADKHHGVHDFSSDQITVAFCNAANAPDVATDEVLADLVQVAYTNLSSRAVTTSSSGQTAGDYQLVVADLTITASGGNGAPFRYVVFYNSTAPGGPLMLVVDYGSDQTILDGDTFLIDSDQVNGLLQELYAAP